MSAPSRPARPAAGQAVPTEGDSAGPGPGRARGGRWFEPAAFAAVGSVLLVVSALSAMHLPLAEDPPAYHRGLPSWLQGWVRWDAGWYLGIAVDGYHYLGPGIQSAVAFFPAYPALMRAGAWVVGDPLLAGILVTLASGWAAVALFGRWCAGLLGEPAARTAVLVLVLYPFAYYLFGAVYSDALFLLGAVGAFLLLERGHPVMSGLAGAVATASRPVGAVVVVALAARAVQLARRDVDRSVPTALAGAGVLLSLLGLLAYCALLWYLFDAPTAFAQVAGAPGWGRDLSLPTVLHHRVIHLALHPALDVEHLRVGLQTLLTVSALALVPAVVRRLGWAYGMYSLLIVGVPATLASDFVGMGRYTLAAFPCFAVAGDLLASPGRERLRLSVLAGSAVLLVVMTSLFARGYYLS